MTRLSRFSSFRPDFPFRPGPAVHRECVASHDRIKERTIHQYKFRSRLSNCRDFARYRCTILNHLTINSRPLRFGKRLGGIQLRCKGFTKSVTRRCSVNLHSSRRKKRKPEAYESGVLPRALHVPTLADYVAFAGSITTGDKQLLCLQQPSKFDSHPGHQFREKQKDLGTDGGA